MEKLEFKIVGSALDDGVPLHVISTGLIELQAILDKPYLYINTKDRIYPRDRQNFSVRAHRMRQGSFIVDLEIIYLAAQLTLPGVIAVGPDIVWEYTVETWKFLKLIYERSKGGEKPDIQTNDNGTTTVVYGDNATIFNGPVYALGQATLPHYKKWASIVRNDGVESLRLGIQENSAIYVDRDTKDLFRLSTKIEEKAIELHCDLFDFNKHKNGGKLSVGAGEVIAPGEYNFLILGDQNQAEYIVSMLNPEVRIKCLREERVDPLGENQVVKLHIIDIAS